MRIVIADDEARARQSVRQIIQKHRPQHAVFEVGNGKEALAQLEVEPCDLLITDIKMPLMDGLTLLEQVKKIAPGTVVVLLSAYSYFSYAQKALKAGAADYLLKPFTDVALLDIVDSAARGQGTQEDITAETDRNSEEKTARAVMFFCPGNNAFGESAWMSIAPRIRAVLSRNGQVERGYVSNDSLRYSVFVPERGLPALEQELLPLLREISREQRRVVAASIGPAQLPGQQHKSLTRAQSNADLFFYREPEPCVLSDNACIVGKPELDSLRTELFSAVQANRPDLASAGLAAVADAMKRCNYPPIQCKDTLILWLDELFTHFQITLPREHKDALRMEAQALRDASVSREFFEGMERVARALCAIVADFRKNKSRLLVELGVEYIRENFRDPTLTPVVIAERVRFNPSYYSNLFKKYTGSSVAQFLLETRLEKAKELLLTTDAKIYKIAQDVGFYDDKYFIRVFAKEFGTTPGAFRAAGCGDLV